MDWSTPDVPAKFRKLYDRARAGKPKAAIRLHCLMCVGWEPVEVERCTATGCPLYRLRNLAAQAETEAADRAKRRERALKAGLRPPITPSADGHGDLQLAPNLSATASALCPGTAPTSFDAKRNEKAGRGSGRGGSRHVGNEKPAPVQFQSVTGAGFGKTE